MLIQNFTTFIWVGVVFFFAAFIAKYYETNISMNNKHFIPKIYPQFFLILAGIFFIASSVLSMDITQINASSVSTITNISAVNITEYDSSMTYTEIPTIPSTPQMFFLGILGTVCIIFAVFWIIQDFAYSGG